MLCFKVSWKVRLDKWY